MSRLAIIPARGGSKRIPRKNIRDFLGKPIIAYSIEAALNSGLFDEVMVSTDDAEIAEIAISHGAIVPFKRSECNSNDFASTVDVLLEVLSAYNCHGKTFETACCLYPTAPFITKKLLEESLDLYVKGYFDSIFPVVAFDYPIQRSLQLDNEGKISMVWPEFLLSRSQDLPKRFHDAGLFYWFRTEIFINQRILTGNNSGALVINPIECQDIDSLQDWEIAELKYQRLFFH